MSINFEPNLCNFVGYLVEDVTLNEANGVKSANFDLDIIRFFERKNGGQGKEKVTAKFEIWDSAAEFLATKSVKGDRVWISASYKSNGTFRVNKFKILNKKKIESNFQDESLVD